MTKFSCPGMSKIIIFAALCRRTTPRRQKASNPRVKTCNILRQNRLFGTMSVALGALFGGLQGVHAQTYNFTPTTGNPSWNIGSNWNGGNYPNDTGLTANFPSPTANEAVDVNVGITVGSINITNNASNAVFTLEKGNSGYLQMDNRFDPVPNVIISGTNANAGNVVIDVNLYENSGRTIKVTDDNVSASTATATAIFTKGIVNNDGGGGFIKAGNGTVAMNAVSNYTGTTVIQAGTLITGVTDALQSTSRITVNSGGTLLFGAGSTDRINNNAAVTLAGGTLNTGGASEGSATSNGIGALTLMSNSVIDLGTGASILAFAATSGQSWTQGSTLSIYNWTGNAQGTGLDQIFFGTNGSGLAQSQLDSILFYSDSGNTALGSAKLLSSGQIVAVVPEPTTILGGMLMISVLGRSLRRRVQ